jgi:hypothetical protein
MKKILAILALHICFVSVLFSQNINDTNQSFSDANLTKAKSIFLSYEKVPKKVYIGEIFSIKVKAIIANDDFDELYSELLDANNTDVINPNSRWQWFSDNIFYNTYYLKVNDKNATLPSIALNITKNSSMIDSGTLKAIAPDIIQLNGTKYFSNVIAHSLHVIKSKTSQFDDKNLIVVLQIKAKQSNLLDFKLSWVNRDGIDSSKNDGIYDKIYYYAIIPQYTKKFDFTYFDMLSNKFIKISIPIVINDDSVSTQIGLNPQESSIQIYKDAMFAIVAFLFLLLFIRRRKKVYLILILSILALFIYSKNPFNSIKIEKNTNLKILPTKNSTIFYTTNRTLYAQLLGSRQDFKKILLPNGKIGWIKDKNASKN